MKTLILSMLLLFSCGTYTYAQDPYHPIDLDLDECEDDTPDSAKDIRDQGIILVTLGVLSHGASLIGVINNDNLAFFLIYNMQGFSLDFAGIVKLIEARKRKKSEKEKIGNTASYRAPYLSQKLASTYPRRIRSKNR